MVLSDCYSWDNEQSGHARLGDPRRTRRLVSLASSLAQHAGLSIVKSSQSTAQVEGAYRLIRNPSVSPQAIAEAGFTATFSDVSRCQQAPSSDCSRQQTYVSGSAWPLLSRFLC